MEKTETYKTLRDEIAIAAMAVMLRNDPALVTTRLEGMKDLAWNAYLMADAMIAAREVE